MFTNPLLLTFTFCLENQEKKNCIKFPHMCKMFLEQTAFSEALFEFMCGVGRVGLG